MENEKRGRSSGDRKNRIKNDPERKQKLMKLLVIPGVAVILAVTIILITVFTRKKETVHISETSVTMTEELAEQDQTDDSGPDNNIYINDFNHYGLQRDAVPEVKELILKYQRAKTTGDVKLLCEVYGKTDTVGIEELEEKLAQDAEVYEAYENTACYTTAGVEEDSYIAYVSTNIRFKGIDTPAPSLTWAYIVKGKDGKYYIKEPSALNDAEKKLLEEVSQSEDVSFLNSDMRSRLAQAVVSDAKLASLYQMLSEQGNNTAAESSGDESSANEGEESVSESADTEIKIGD